MLNLRFALGIFSVGMMVPGAGVVLGQEYPNKPIRIVTAAAGSGGDVTARLTAQGISGTLGQPIIVDNRGTGVLAAEIASKAPSDGYTLLVNGPILWITPLLRKAPYDAVRDFSPISLIERGSNILAVHPSVPVKSVKELIAFAKAKPGALNYASSATGSSSHLAGELFNSMAGINIVHIPYKGSGAAVIALIGGQVQVMFATAPSLAPHVKSGQLRALAVTSAQPSALVPGVPTVAASGLPGYEAVQIIGIWAPAKTPGVIINRLNQEIVRFVNRADVKERFLDAGVEVVGSTPEQFAAFIKSEIATMGKVIRDVGIKVE